MAIKVLTPNYQRRLAHANQACRELRQAGYRVLSIRVPAGATLERSHIEVTGGNAADRPEAEGVEITRRVGGVR